MIRVVTGVVDIIRIVGVIQNVNRSPGGCLVSMGDG